MGNAVLDNLLAQREAQTQFIDTLLARVAEEDRDLVDAERSNLEAAKQRIAEIDKQVAPLEEFEQIRGAHRTTQTAVNGPTATHRPDAGGALGVRAREQKYPTAGHFLVDYLRAVGNQSRNEAPDPDAAQRVAAALGRAVNDVPAGNHVTTADTPGLLPEPIIGEVLTQLDGSRPFIQSVGIKPLEAIPGKTFERPKVTTSTSVQEQTAEKGELVVGDFKVDPVAFTKRTFGGMLNVSRQDIDWTSPSAWNILLQDLQFEYAEETEDIVAAAFAATVTQEQEIPFDDQASLAAWIKALYLAAVKAATANGTKRARARRLPNMIWTSIDMWATIGALVDAVRVQNNNGGKLPGEASLTGFAGSLLDVPRVMVPGFAEGTVVVGRSQMFEFYEQRIGLLQAVEPKYLGVQVAYGGYAAFGSMDATAFAKVTIGEDTP